MDFWSYNHLKNFAVVKIYKLEYLLTENESSIKNLKSWKINTNLYFSGDEVRDLEMDEAFIQVFLFCLSEDREYISLQRQHLNIFGLVAVAGLPQYTNLVRRNTYYH